MKWGMMQTVCGSRGLISGEEEDMSPHLIPLSTFRRTVIYILVIIVM